MKHGNVYKNTKLVSNGNLYIISFQLLNQYLVNINKDYEKNFLNFVN